MAPLYLGFALLVANAALLRFGDGKVQPVCSNVGSCICEQTCSYPGCKKAFEATCRIEDKLKNMTSSMEGKLDATQDTVKTIQQGVNDLTERMPTDELKDYLEEKLDNMTSSIENIQATVDNLTEICGAKVRCPEDFTYDEPTEMCFKLYVEDKVTFEQAELSCLRYDSGIRTHLAMVDTEEKRLMLAHHIEPEPQSMPEDRFEDNSRQMWVGGKQIENDDTFYWIATGEEFGKNAPWGSGQPDDNGDCVTIARIHDWDHWYLNDSNCADKLMYVCEYLLT